MRLSVATWNVLADCYVHGMSSRLEFCREWGFRRSLLKACIERTSIDLFCMQEIDHFEDFYSGLFDSLGYGTIYMQRPSKGDGCLIAFKNDRFELLDKVHLNLDFLAHLDTNAQQKGRSKFAKQNVAILALLRERHSSKSFISATCHLHWNPHLVEVKYAQAHYILSQLQLFRQQHDNAPIIWTGDFNSLPNDEVYKLITSPASPPTSLALPLPRHSPHSLPSHLVLPANYARGPKTRFICDNSLSRLGRWMRVLGVDVAQGTGDWGGAMGGTTESSAKLKNNSQYEELKRQSIAEFFTKARQEGRVILTSSPSLIQRSTCPPAFLIKPDNLHKGLIEIYWEFQLELSVDKFLTVCGKCGGGIAEYPTPASASTTTATYTDHSPVESVMVASAPPLPPQWRERSIPTDRPVYYCVSCHQPYWWNEGESSSPAKAMKKAHLLYEAIKKGLQDKSDMRGEVVNKEVKVDDGHPVEGEKTWLEQAADLSNDLDSTSVSLSALFMNRDRVLASREQPENVSTIQQAQAQESSISGGGLASVFAAGEPLLTNWNGDFQGTLDYIFVSPEWAAQEAKVVPTVDKGLIAREQDIGICSASRSTETVLTHSQPSEFWPSDHLMVVAQLLLT